jgi:hypothetical protein
VNGRSTVRGIVFGVLAAIAVALAYGVLSEPFEFSLGLLVVGFAGGWLIGNSIAYGAYAGGEHDPYPPLQWAAVVISAVAWVGALVIAYVITQLLLPQASTPLTTRLSLQGFLDYFVGLDLTRFIHLIALALMTFMAHRGAR